MKAYQAGHAKFIDARAQVLAISSDDAETLRQFRDKHAGDVAFVADPKGELIERFGVKTPLLTFAKRTTFVIGTAGTILAVETGDAALDPTRALNLARSAAASIDSR